ncbi:MAG TPA: MFS transporter [Acidimicrobiales bacterium]|nr:MFS transporter [Acidimicrobiales bacterium]
MTLARARPAPEALAEPPDSPTGAPTGLTPGGRRWLLVVCCVAQFMVILDLSIVNVALPSIQSSLNFSATELQWVVDAYAIFFAGFLMLGGRAADYLGQRRTFVAALLLFALTSLAGGLSVDHQMLVVARAAQGISGALMAATSLAIITSSFAAGPARHRAIALWGAMNGAGGAAGTVLGGVITQELSWRWVLLINPPIGIAAAVVAHRVVTERRKERGTAGGRRFDAAGALTLTLGQLVLIYGVVTAGVDGWTSPDAIVPMVAGAGLLALFIMAERRASAPLVPLAQVTGPLRLANVIVLLFSAALFPMWYVSSLYLQQVLGLSPLDAGFAFLPMALAIMLCASRAGKLVGRFGVRAVLGGGLAIMASGMLLFTRIAPTGSALTYVVLPGVLTAAGIGLSIVPSTIFATQGAGPAQAGLASGLVNTSRQAGGGFGLALLISLATAYTSGAVGRNVAVPAALTDGFRIAYLVGAGLVAAAAVVTFVFVKAPALGPAGPRRRLAGCVVLVVAGFYAISFGSGQAAAPIGAYSTAGAYSFVSAPGLHPPKVKADIPTDTSQLAPGYIMVANFYDLTTSPMVGQSGPLILDDNLQPVWFQPVPKDVVASNLTSQTYKGQPVLTWWQGVVSDTGATQSGEDIIVNRHYQKIATLKGQDGWVITLHELVISGGDAWVTANKDMPMNLSKYGGPADGVLDDSAVQEYDIATGKLLYTWDALDHIPLTASETQPPPNGFPWDAYHVNSIDLVGATGFVVSMRNTWAAYKVDSKTGAIEWELGGKHSTFNVPANASFEWQHDVQLHDGSIVTMFDDDCCQITGAGTYLAPAGPSRALELRLNMSDHTVSLVAQYTHGQDFDSAYMGDNQLLANGNVFVGWGSQPYFSEYTKSGKLVLDASLPFPDLSYRATVGTWVGLPDYPPKGAARQTTSGETTVYASWNGATQVASWKVLAGSDDHDLTVVARSAKTGFETGVSVKGKFTSFEVQALNSKGQVIGTSKSFAQQETK